MSKWKTREFSKEPKDIWNLLLGHVLGGTKSQSAKVKEFIKKRVTPWVDFTTIY